MVETQKCKVWCAWHDIDLFETIETTETIETIETTTSSGITLQVSASAVSAVSALSALSALSAVSALSVVLSPLSARPISCQKGLDLALTRKLADGTYSKYFPFASLTEESKMTPYHKK